MNVLKKIIIVLAVGYCLLCAAVYFFQEKLLFIPQPLSADYKFNFNTEFTEVNIPSRSGNVLNGLYFTCENPRGVVVYFHGNAGNIGSWGSVWDDFIPLGFDLLITDYAGYGKSTGKMSEENLYTDAQSVYDFCKGKFSEDKIILYGRSIGTGIAAYIAAKNNPKKLILEAPYFSMKDLASRLYPFLPSIILRYPLRTDLFLPKVKCQVTIFHGTEDEIIYPESSERLKPFLKPGDNVYFIDGGHHNDLRHFQSYKKLLSQKLSR